MVIGSSMVYRYVDTWSMVVVCMVVALILTIMIGATIMQQRVFSMTKQITDQRNAPVATSGDNVYIAWWTNKTGNNESTNAESVNASIAAEGDHVYVSWWERNATSNEPVLKISNDNGKAFGPILKLSANGTIGSSG
jgi:hypothetical protein